MWTDEDDNPGTETEGHMTEAESKRELEKEGRGCFSAGRRRCMTALGTLFFF